MNSRNHLYIIFLAGFFTFACNSFQSDDQEAHENTVESAEVQDLTKKGLLLTNVDQLRLRMYPDVKSKMLTTFDENTPLYYEAEQTDFVDKIGKHKGPWMKVSTVDGELNGWVYGAEHFVESWLTRTSLDSLHETGKDIRIFNNLNRSELSKLTGANFDGNVAGTRYSGYYEFSIGTDPQMINGKVRIRARVFDEEKREVQFIPCSLTVDEGMPTTQVTCFENEEAPTTK